MPSKQPSVRVSDSIPAQSEFETLEEAKAALAHFVKQSQRGARVERSDCNGLGIDLVIDEKDAKDMEVIHWQIRKQYRSKWEIVEQA